ncbi:MAG: hypothetical protein QOK02_979 [Mycobacterium sp.]|nr:hypothetical protein [Mycobacterium sp.]
MANVSEVQLLDIGDTERDVLTRWDITGHQANRPLLSKVLHFSRRVGSLADIGSEAHPGQDDVTPSLRLRLGSNSCG